MLNIETDISPYVASLLPRFIQGNYPLFMAFLRAYEEWLATSGNVGEFSKSMLTYTDIDTTLPMFVSHFQNKYLQGTPLVTAISTPSLVKNVKALIASKGTSNGVRLFLQLLFNQPSNVYIPGRDILRASDGVWVQYPYLEVSFGVSNKDLEGNAIIGSQSGATAFVRSLKLIPLTYSNRVRSVLVMENAVGTFIVGETVSNPAVASDAMQNPVVLGSLNNIMLSGGGIGYNVGDELEISSDKGVGGVIIVNSVLPKNGVVNFVIQDGGGSYANSTTDPTNFTDTAVTTSQDATNPGINATFQIGNLSNTYALTVYNDFIYPYVSTNMLSLSIQSGGSKYKAGDELIFIRSATDNVPILSSSFGGVGIPANNAIATVNTVDGNGMITTLTVVNSGEYVGAPAIIINSNAGVGAIIDAIMSTSLPTVDATAYGLPKNPTANGSTQMSLSLESATIEVGTIASLFAVNPGEGYTGTVAVDVTSSVIASLHIMTTSDGVFDGENAVVIGTANKGEGSISSATVVDSGVGYVDGEYLNIAMGNATVAASGRAVIAGAGTQLGHWQDTRGFLNADKYIQDSYYYQAFSYEIQSPLPVERYGNTVKRLWHMAGTEMFGRSVIEDVVNTNPVTYIEVSNT